MEIRPDEFALHLLSGSVFAAWLCTPRGKAFDDSIKTRYIVVCIGVILVLLVLAIRNPKEAQNMFIRFAVAGTPFALRAAAYSARDDEDVMGWFEVDGS